MGRKLTVKAVRLGKSLKQARTQVADLTLRRGAELVGWKHQRLDDMENGIGPYRDTEIASLLGAYGVTGTLHQRILLEVATLNESVLLQRSMPDLPDDVAALDSYEEQASEGGQVEEWSPLMPPGLVQTMDFAREFMRADGLAGGPLEVRLAMRSRRQQRLHEGLRYTAYVTEHSLRMPAANRAMNVAQLDKILDLARRPNVNVVLVPPDMPISGSQLGGFILLTFSESDPLVQVENHGSVVWVTEDELTSKYLRSAVQLASVGMDATEYIVKLKRELEGTP